MTVARTRCARRKTPTTTGTSSSPTWCRSTRRRSGSNRCGPALPPLPAARRRRARRDHRGRGRRRGRRRRRRPWAGSRTCVRSWQAPVVMPARALVHVKEAYADQGPSPAVPAGDLAALTRLEVEGKLTATQAKQVLAQIVADGGGDAAGDRGRQGASRPWTRARSTRSSRRRSPPTPARGRSIRAGEDRALGALVGAVMKASRGQADGAAVTALPARPPQRLTIRRVWAHPRVSGRTSPRQTLGCRETLGWRTSAAGQEAVGDRHRGVDRDHEADVRGLLPWDRCGRPRC